jgi:hypothetical protein
MLRNIVFQLGLAYLLFLFVQPFLLALSVAVFPPKRTIFFAPRNLASPTEIVTWSFSRVHSQHYIALSLMALGAVITLVRKPGPGDNGVAAPRAAGAPGMAPRPGVSRCGCAVEPSALFCEYCGQKR